MPNSPASSTTVNNVVTNNTNNITSDTFNTIKGVPQRQLLMVNGPNLNLLGKREPEIYGVTTLQDIEARLTATAQAHNISLRCVQSNSESELIDTIQWHGLLANTCTDGEENKLIDGVIINPAAFTHTSVALRDALLATAKPFIEVHLSNIHSREPFRSKSYFSDCAIGVICGLGHIGYDMALNYFINQYKNDFSIN